MHDLVQRGRREDLDREREERCGVEKGSSFLGDMRETIGRRLRSTLGRSREPWGRHCAPDERGCPGRGSLDAHGEASTVLAKTDKCHVCVKAAS